MMRLFLTPFALFPLVTIFHNSFALGALIQNGSVFYGIRDQPYCELLVNILNSDQSISQYAFNTLGFNNCPEDWFSNITNVTIANAYYDQYGVMPYSAAPNGPKNFVMDILNQTILDPQPNLTVNGETLGLRGIVSVPAGTPLAGASPYHLITIARNSTWTYLKDSLVHLLIDPNGTIYTMQAYSKQVDANLTSQDLDSTNIGGKLQLPSGWRYETRQLNERLDNVANGATNTIGDNLRNGYQITPTLSPINLDSASSIGHTDLSALSFGFVVIVVGLFL